MPKIPKAVIYLAVGLVGLWLLIGIGRRVHPHLTTYRLKRALTAVEPWPESSNYTAAAWKRIIRAGRAFQNAPPKLAQNALEQFARDQTRRPATADVELSKAFLLLRVMFDVPEHAPPEQRVALAQWETRGTDRHPDGMVNLAWPLVWNEGRPRLVAGRAGSAGPRYAPQDEFALFRYRYKPRDLSTFRSAGD